MDVVMQLRQWQCTTTIKSADRHHTSQQQIHSRGSHSAIR
jgi:hypothetical protein